jgi:phenylacetate-CoA ligase
LQPGIDRVAILHPGLLSPFLEASAQALKNLNVGHLRIFPIEGVCDYKRIYEVLCRYEITTVMTTPSLAYKILYQLRKFGPLDGLFLNKLLLTGELITSVNILNFKKVLGCDALVVPFVYGGSETASLMIGRDDGRYNPILEDFIFEIPNGKIDRSISHVSKVLGELVVTWLREGVLPIRRYKTGDYFSATYNENTNEYIFEPLGRMSHTPDEIATANEVENILYGIKEMVWNYAVVASVQLRQINIELTVDSISVESNEAIREKLVSLFGRDYEVRLNINKETDKFLEFAAIPKTSKFSYI